MSRIFPYVIIMLVFSAGLHASPFIYAPGIAVPFTTYHSAIRHAIKAFKHMQILHQNAVPDVTIDEDQRVATVTDTYHTVYVPLFLDYHRDACDVRCIAQERDIADLFYTHMYAVERHDDPIHFIGHSRGAGTIATYLGMLGYGMMYACSDNEGQEQDRDQLRMLAETYWSSSRACLLEEPHLYQRLSASVGIACFMATFDNLLESLQAIMISLPLSSFLQDYIENPRLLYETLNSYVQLPHYDWNTDMTPRTLASYIPAHVPCIYVHTEKDPINPVEVAYDLYNRRSQVAPEITRRIIISNTCWLAWCPWCHIEVPYLRQIPEIAEAIAEGISWREAQNISQCQYRYYPSHSVASSSGR